jgi:hypothetical protein
MSRVRWRSHYAGGAVLATFVLATGCLNVLGIDTDRPYVDAGVDSTMDSGNLTSDSAGSDSLGDDSVADGTLSENPSVDADADADADAEARAEAAVDSSAADVVNDATDAGSAPEGGGINPGPPCRGNEAGALSRTPFNASIYLCGPPTAYAAPASGCGMTAQLGTSSTARLEIENYDVGGEGVTYHDTTPGNYYGQYRGEDVDVEYGVCSPPPPCAAVDYIAPSEYLEYTINMTSTYSYYLDIGYAARGSEGIHLDLDGKNIIHNTNNELILPATTSPGQAFTSLSYQYFYTQQYVCLPQGKHILRVTFDGPDDQALAMDFIDFQPMMPCTAPIPDAGGGG